ncbi:substrate-binding domain-containing protein [Oryzobacter sp. R7]|uniref:substrate-binding domain-containing protein n=1 Tax=Oryzobacter faecalis TaxID=3388656 RepID=UPI00398CCD45
MQTRRLVAALALAAVALGPAACVREEGRALPGGGSNIRVSLITKDATNPYFTAIEEAARSTAERVGVDVAVTSGASDDARQLAAIDAAVARGDRGILITPVSSAVESAMKKARDLGLYVIALDSPPDTPGAVDVTFASDNRKAGKLLGGWVAAELGGRPATIALLGLDAGSDVRLDRDREEGFLEGMGIAAGDPRTRGDVPRVGRYPATSSGTPGGAYSIDCVEATAGTEAGGRTAMESCLAAAQGISVVYTVNERVAEGAVAALEGGDAPDVVLVSFDGGCEGVEAVAAGTIDATVQQFPLRMATLGVESIARVARGGEKPEPTEGLDLVDTGVALVADRPRGGVASIDTTEAARLCWG